MFWSFQSIGPIGLFWPRFLWVYGGILALRAHCALLLDYVPPEEPLGTPLGNTLRIRRPKLDWRGP